MLCCSFTGAGLDLCVVQTPLVTRHFQAWRQMEEALPTRGCSNRSGIVTTHEVKNKKNKRTSILGRLILFLNYYQIRFDFIWIFRGKTTAVSS